MERSKRGRALWLAETATINSKVAHLESAWRKVLVAHKQILETNDPDVLELAVFQSLQLSNLLEEFRDAGKKESQDARPGNDSPNSFVSFFEEDSLENIAINSSIDWDLDVDKHAEKLRRELREIAKGLVYT